MSDSSRTPAAAPVEPGCPTEVGHRCGHLRAHPGRRGERKAVSVIAAPPSSGTNGVCRRRGLSARAPPRERHRAACTRTRSPTARASRRTRADRPGGTPRPSGRTASSRRTRAAGTIVGRWSARPNALTNSSFVAVPPTTLTGPARSDSSACRYACAASASANQLHDWRPLPTRPPTPSLNGSIISATTPPSRARIGALRRATQRSPASRAGSAACSQAATTSAANPLPFGLASVAVGLSKP